MKVKTKYGTLEDNLIVKAMTTSSNKDNGKMKKVWRDILVNEGLSDWKVIVGSGGGLTMSSKKTIYVSPNDDALFLHEVAHALKNNWNGKMGDKTGHHAIWGDCLTNLVRRYMKLTDLAHKDKGGNE